MESQPTTAQVQPLNLSGGPEPSLGDDSPITDKESEQSSSVLSPGVDSPIADKECEQSSPAVSPGVNSPMADKESEQSSSVLCDRIRDLEIKAKATTGESRE